MFAQGIFWNKKLSRQKVSSKKSSREMVHRFDLPHRGRINCLTSSQDSKLLCTQRSRWKLLFAELFLSSKVRYELRVRSHSNKRIWDWLRDLSGGKSCWRRSSFKKLFLQKTFVAACQNAHDGKLFKSSPTFESAVSQKLFKKNFKTLQNRTWPSPESLYKLYRWTMCREFAETQFL